MQFNGVMDSTTVHFQIATMYQEMKSLLEESGIPESKVNIMTMNETDLQDLLLGLQRIKREEYEKVRHIKSLHTPGSWDMLKAFGETNLREHQELRKAQTELRKIWRRLEKRYAPPKPKQQEVAGCDDV
jgi:hypothetical protein